MKYYAVIDTNVIVSAMIKESSIPAQIVSYAMRGKIVTLLDKEVMLEYREVLSRPKFNLETSNVEKVLNEIEGHGIYLKARKTDQEFTDESDKKFYDLLMALAKKQEAYLVTGNTKHFPDKFFIVAPR